MGLGIREDVYIVFSGVTRIVRAAQASPDHGTHTTHLWLGRSQIDLSLSFAPPALLALAAADLLTC